MTMTVRLGMNRREWFRPFMLLLLLQVSLRPPRSLAFSANNGENDVYFSLSAYQRARAMETTRALDASRFHFQILFVDDNNFHGRIAEGLLGRVAEYNDAMCVLFPASATITAAPSSRAPLDAAPPGPAIAICESLGLCDARCSALGTAFDLSYLDEYDLVIAMDDQIRSLILRSLGSADDEAYYAPKCRLLSEFLSPNFCRVSSRRGGRFDGNNHAGGETDDDAMLRTMLDYDLFERTLPFSDLVRDRSSNIFSSDGLTLKDYTRGAPRVVLTDDGVAVPNLAAGWPLVEAAMIVASTGITQFCLDTMDSQMETTFQSLLEQHFCREEHLHGMSWEQADDQLRKSSFAITGYFSPQQRRTRFDRHMDKLRTKIKAEARPDSEE